MELLNILHALGIPAAYMKFDKVMTPPYAVYYGDGQEQFTADDTPYVKKTLYTLEYYFAEKSAAREQELEEALTAGGFAYDKSADAYISDEKVSVIYYTTWRK